MAQHMSKNSSNSKTIYIIEGGKGGIGKSNVSTIVGDRLVKKGQAETLLVLDGDVTNCDVSRRFKNSGAMIGDADLRVSEEWLCALDILETSEAETIVINMPATALIGERKDTLRTVATELGYRVVVFFLMGKTPDSVVLVTESHKSGLLQISDAYLIVLNEFFGKAATFRRWEESSARMTITSDPRCAGVMVLPELFYSAADVLQAALDYTPSQIIESGGLTVGTRVELKTWLEKAWQEIDKTDLVSAPALVMGDA